MLANYIKTQKINNNKLNSIFNIFLLFPQKDSNQQFLFDLLGKHRPIELNIENPDFPYLVLWLL